MRHPSLLLPAMMLAAITGLAQAQGAPGASECPEGTLLQPRTGVCAAVRDRRSEFVPQAEVAVGGSVLPDLRLIRGTPDGQPRRPASGIGVGVGYRQGLLQALNEATLHTTMVVRPEGAGDLPDWLFTTATNRTEKGVEVVGIYRQSEVHDIGVFDWSCSPEDPCANGSTAPAWIWTVPLQQVACNYGWLQDDAGHAVQALYYANQTKTGAAGWDNAVYFWNDCNQAWDLVYWHPYGGSQHDCSQDSACGWWGPILETFMADPQPPIDELGFFATQLLHDGQESHLGPEDTWWTDPHAPWLLLHRAPNRSWGVATPQLIDQAPVPVRPRGQVEGPRPTFEWQPVPFATQYRLVVTVAAVRVLDRTVPATTFTPGQDLQLGAEHLWTVRGVNDSGPGPESAPVSFTPIQVYTAPPEPPVLLAPEHCIATLTPTFTWLPAERAVDYKIAIWHVAPEWLLLYSDSSGTSFTPDYAQVAFEAGQEYRWWVKARNSRGETWSQQMFYFTPSLFCSPPPAISVNDVTVTEGSSGTTLATFTLTLSEPSPSTVSVSYATASGTATAGSDFLSISGQASFDPGVTSQTVDVTVVADTLGEPPETFYLNLSNPTNATLADAQGVGTIADDDGTTETPLWTKASGVATLPGGGLSKLGGDGWAGAVTQKGFMGQRGELILTATETNTKRAFGLGYRFTGQSLADLDFAILLDSDGNASVYESETQVESLGPYATGDVFKVVVRAGPVRYFKNGVAVYTSTKPSPARPVRGQALLYSAGATLGDVTMVGAQVRVEDVTFENTVGVTASGNNLTKTAPDGWDNAGATSLETLVSGEGFVEAVASETTTRRMFGLSNGNTGPSYHDIDFAIYLSSDYYVVGAYIYESGALVRDLGTYIPGDRFRVSVKSGTVEYSKNGVPVHRSAGTPVFPLLVDTSLYDTGATLKDVVLAGFLSPEDVSWPSVANVMPAGNSLVDGQPGAIAASGETLTGPGFLEFEATESTKLSRTVGFKLSPSPLGWNVIAIGIGLMPDGHFWAVEEGSPVLDLGTYASGDRFRITASGDPGSASLLKVGGPVLYTNKAKYAYPLQVLTSFSSSCGPLPCSLLPGATLKDVVLARPPQ